MSSNIKYMPFRNFRDFIYNDKYSMPAVHDLNKFNNRVVSNLLYYQTNYLAFALGFVVMFLSFGFQKFMIGSFAVAPAIALILRQFGMTKIFDNIQRQNPNSILIAGLLELIILYLAYNQVMYFLLGVAVPVGFSILHAAFKTRNTKNMVNNTLERVSGAIYDNTPMEYVLKAIGVETRGFDE